MLTFLDPPRPDTAETLRRAREYGVDVKMITGDHKAIARETCRQLGLGDNILGPEGLPELTEDGRPPADLGNYAPLILGADGFAQVFPEHKFLIVEALRRAGYAVGMTGDGVNDAPALKKADIGIAVQGSTDAARAAADIVLTSPGLSVIIDAIAVSRCIFQRIQNFVIYRRVASERWCMISDASSAADAVCALAGWRARCSCCASSSSRSLRSTRAATTSRTCVVCSLALSFACVRSTHLSRSLPRCCHRRAAPTTGRSISTCRWWR
jgi:hypothetical protein